MANPFVIRSGLPQILDISHIFLPLLRTLCDTPTHKTPCCKPRIYRYAALCHLTALRQRSNSNRLIADIAMSKSVVEDMARRVTHDASLPSIAEVIVRLDKELNKAGP